MAYRIGTYQFSREREYQAGLRDAEKIKKIAACEGDDYTRSKKILEAVKKENIIFETIIGEEFIKKVRNYVKEESDQTESKWKKIARMGGIVLLSCIVAVFGNQYITTTVDNYISRKDLDALVQEKEQTEMETSVVIEPELKKEKVKTTPILNKYKKLWNQNNDLKGWLQIENTPIDYPVMLHKKDNDFYLKHNFEKEEDINGLLVLDNRCDINTDGGQYIVYGHNMKSGAMFGELLNYKDEAYYKNNKKIMFDTLYESGEFEIISVFLTKVFYQDEDAFKFYNYTSFQSEKDFDLYIKQVKELSLYKIEAHAQYGDTLLALTTCEYSQENGRIVVIARKNV